MNRQVKLALQAEAEAAEEQARHEAATREAAAYAAKVSEALKTAKADLTKRLKPVGDVNPDIRYERREPHRPAGRDENAPSRHETIAPASIVVMFNSHRSTFELSHGAIKSLPETLNKLGQQRALPFGARGRLRGLSGGGAAEAPWRRRGGPEGADQHGDPWRLLSYFQWNAVISWKI